MTLKLDCGIIRIIKLGTLGEVYYISKIWEDIKMKRILVSILLILTLVASSFSAVSAAGDRDINWIKSEFSDPAHTVKFNITLEAKGSTGSYASTISSLANNTVSAKATVDMTGIKGKLATASTLATDAAWTEFAGKKITGTFSLKVDLGDKLSVTAPLAAPTVEYLDADGNISADGGLFTIGTPSIADNEITVVLTLKPDLTVGEFYTTCPSKIAITQTGITYTSGTTTVDASIASAETKVVEADNTTEFATVMFDAETVNSVTIKQYIGGGGGSTTVKPSEPETVVNPDGSITTSQTDKNGTTTSTTTNTDGSSTVVEKKKDGSVTVTEKDAAGKVTETSNTVVEKDGSSTTVVENANGSTSTTKTDSTGSSETKVEVSKEAAESSKVELPMPSVQVSPEAEKAPVVDVKLPETVTAEAPVKVVIPVEEPTTGTVAVLVKEDGTTEVVRTSVVTEDGVSLSLNGSATIQIVDNSKGFVDIDGHWGIDSINYTTAREIFNGTSETTFEPETGMTRGMFVQVIHNIEDNPAHTFDGSFHDVEDHHWYEEAVHWAAEEEIVKGYASGHFGPEDVITREQLAAMLWRYANHLGFDTSVGEDTNILSYKDADKISEYAIPAVQWACGAGLMKGTSVDMLTPAGTATRAQVATMLHRFCTLVFN